MDAKYPNIRLYAQMRPDAANLEHLLALQAALPAQQRGRPAPARGLHLTLIHFGKVWDVYEVIAARSEISYKTYIDLLMTYIRDSAGLLPEREYELPPLNFARFGQRGGTLVVEYQPPQELLRIHAELYTVLRKFLQRCGIENVDSFMAADANFMHAAVLRPHITLYKGYAGPLPDLVLQPVRVHAMPLIYPPLA